MGKNKQKSFTKQKLSNFSRSRNLDEDMIDDLGDDFNEMKHASSHSRKL